MAPLAVGGHLHTEFMTHDVLHAALSAQASNALLAGSELRAAAENLASRASSGTCLKALDAAGERIIGAALMLSDSLSIWDYTAPFPPSHTCLLVGGVVAGPAGVAAAARAALAAGAASVDVALLGGWTRRIEGVAHIREIGPAQARVA